MANKGSKESRELTTEERLENGIRHQPDRYLAERGPDDHLVSVADRDTGRLWVRVEGGWAWIE